MNILLIIFDGLADRPAPELKGRTPLAAARGGLRHLRGADFMPVLLNAAERTNMYEMRPTAHHRLYRPRLEDVEPFQLPD